eukprot:scaffold129050_cov35-Tisochrysis_lutea.AAC.4
MTEYKCRSHAHARVLQARKRAWKRGSISVKRPQPQPQAWSFFTNTPMSPHRGSMRSRTYLKFPSSA